MVTITADPSNPERLIVTQTVTLYLDRVLLSSLSAEVEAAIRTQAAKDLKRNGSVKRQIAAAATAKLLNMLGVPPEPATIQRLTPEAVPTTPRPYGTYIVADPAIDLKVRPETRAVVESIFRPERAKD